MSVTYSIVLRREDSDVTVRGNRPVNELSNLIIRARDYNNLASKFANPSGVYVVVRD